MSLGALCHREVVTATVEASVLEASLLMRHQHVGTVIIVEPREDMTVPVGIVTDRDIVLEIVAPGLDPEVMTVGDIMSPEFTTIKESAGLFEAIQHMRSMAVRRLPVVCERGELVGILTLDDLLVLLADELHAVSRLVEREQQNEIHARP